MKTEQKGTSSAPKNKIYIKGSSTIKTVKEYQFFGFYNRAVAKG
jgi:hypothetical protein